MLSGFLCFNMIQTLQFYNCKMLVALEIFFFQQDAQFLNEIFKNNWCGPDRSIHWSLNSSELTTAFQITLGFIKISCYPASLGY